MPKISAIPAELVETPARARRLYRAAPDFAVSETGLQVLVFLVRSRAASAVDVQSHLELEQSRASHAIKALRSKRLVASSVDLGDKRRQVLRPTRAGSALVARFLATVEPGLGQEQDPPQIEG